MTHWLTDSLTGVKCRATSVANKKGMILKAFQGHLKEINTGLQLWQRDSTTAQQSTGNGAKNTILGNAFEGISRYLKEEWRWWVGLFQAGSLRIIWGWRSEEAKECVACNPLLTSGGTLRQDNCQLIGQSLIILVRWLESNRQLMN